MCCGRGVGCFPSDELPPKAMPISVSYQSYRNIRSKARVVEQVPTSPQYLPGFGLGVVVLEDMCSCKPFLSWIII